LAILLIVFGQFNQLQLTRQQLVGTLHTMHWQWIYAQNLSEMSIYEVTHNLNVTWYKLLS